LFLRTILASYETLSISKLVHLDQLLRFLSVYDILVCLCGCLTYGLPPVSNLYKEEVLTRIGPWIAPITHAALVTTFNHNFLCCLLSKLRANIFFVLTFQMTSVYCTVILSLERYIRICFLCQLREWSYPSITGKNVTCYKVGLTVIPVIFYLPKFFELRWVNHKVNKTIFLLEKDVSFISLS